MVLDELKKRYRVSDIQIEAIYIIKTSITDSVVFPKKPKRNTQIIGLNTILSLEKRGYLVRIEESETTFTFQLTEKIKELGL